MELNLYGVASIQLDRLKGGRMRRILGLFTTCKNIQSTIIYL